jgi:hypothetical protein
MRWVSVTPGGLKGAAIRTSSSQCSIIGLLVVVMGCASAPVSRTDVRASIAWRVTAFQRVPTTVHERFGERYTFTLLLHEQSGVGITFTRVAQTVSAVHVQPMTVVQDSQWRLPPKGELLLPFRLLWSCPAASGTCSSVAGSPRWHILLTGTDDHNDPVQLDLKVDVPDAEAVVAESRSVYPSDPL